MKEEIYYITDSLGVTHEQVMEVPSWSISSFFVEGGLGYMILITLLLIGVFLAAWKAPRWVKEIGLGALVVGAFATVLGLYQVMDAMAMFANDISLTALFSGLKVALDPLLYGLVAYFVSLVIRVVQKPRI